MKQPSRLSLRGLSLRRGVPLLVSSLTASALIVAGALAYAEIRGAALTAAEARLRAVSVELMEFSAASVEQRVAVEEEVTSSPEVQAALRGRMPDSAALERRLLSLPGTPTSIVLVSADGRPVFTLGPSGAEHAWNAPLGSARGFGSFQVGGGRATYWMSVPVPGGGEEPIGWIVQRRTIGDPTAGSLIEDIIGNGITIALGRAGDSLWIDLGGEPRPAPPHLILDEPFRYRVEDGPEVLAHGGLVPGGPWVLLAQSPMDRVLTRPRTFLVRALPVGGAILLLVLLASWRLARRLAGPLGDLSTAADAMARGDYAGRVRTKGAEEMVRLGTAFNTMAERVAHADERLREQLEEAHALAVRLEEASAEANRAREEAQNANRAKSHFLAAMSHEIRTPIHAIMGYTALLGSGLADPPSESQRQYLQRIERASRILVSLVDDVLDFSRIESGKVSLRMGIESAEEAVLAAVAALQPLAAAKRVHLEAECDRTLRFRGDLLRVQQILLNLLSNAVKFTGEEGTVTVTCTHDPEHGRIRFDVQDTGIGIEADQVEQLFEPFVQAAPSFPRDSQGGAGLGLAISRRLASLMSGEITVESEPGRGSRFTLWLEAASTGEPVAAS